jgi:GPH family glycoside/pentoside/hexuronide:cation symporter
LSEATAVPARTLVAYGIPTLGLSFALFFVQFYFLKFATDVLLLPPAWMGWLFAAAKLYDAFVNPVVGGASDRSRSRFGRRAPFLVAALPVFVVSFAMLWDPPALGATWLTAWVAVGLVLFFTAFALYAVPHAALGAELSTDSHDRTRLFGARHVGFTLGMMLSFAAMDGAMNAVDPRAAAAEIAMPAIVAAVAVLVVPLLFVRAPAAAAAARGGKSTLHGLRDVWRNEPARLLLIVYFVEALGAGAIGVMAPYVTEYWLGRPDLVAWMPASYVLAGIVSVPLWVRVSRRYGKRDTWLATMLLAGAAFAGLFVYGDSIVASLALLSLAGAAGGAGGVLSASILADLIDRDEQRTGERKEGVYSAAMGLVLKLGTSLAVAASGLVLSAVGFTPNAEQSEESVFGIRLLFAGFPCLGYVIGAAIFLRFPQDGRLAERAAPAGAAL